MFPESVQLNWLNNPHSAAGRRALARVRSQHRGGVQIGIEGRVGGRAGLLRSSTGDNDGGRLGGVV